VAGSFRGAVREGKVPLQDLIGKEGHTKLGRRPQHTSRATLEKRGPALLHEDLDGGIADALVRLLSLPENPQ